MPIDPQSSATKTYERLDAQELSATDAIAALTQASCEARSCNALCELDLQPDRQAEQSDARRRAGKAGALEGITFSVKDNIALDGAPTTGGSPALARYTPPEGLAISRLRAQGAIFSAKTKLHELAFGITGANRHTGDVLNPFDRSRLAGGSSAGAAVAVATGACAIAIGTDTGGSCRIPAAHCGVVGFRPSTFRYPLDGYLRLSPSRDTLGLLARSVADIALADAAIAPEPEAPTTSATRPWRLGVVRGSPIDGAVAYAFEQSLTRLRLAGFELVEADLSDALAADETCGFAIALFETARSMEWLARAACNLELIDFAATISSEDVRGLIASQCGGDAIGLETYVQAMTVDLPHLKAAFAQALETVDALVYPTSPIVAPPVDHGELVEVGAASIPAFAAYTLMSRPDSMAGVPSISLPCGLAYDMPVGLQLTGRAGQDRRLLTLAEIAEAVLPTRPVPTQKGSASER